MNEITHYKTKNHIILLNWSLLCNISPNGTIHVKKFGNTEYAYINKKIKGKTKTYLLHRLLVEAFIGRKLLKSEFIDHINHNSLDNRIENLRICSLKENSRNRNSNKYKGVKITLSGKYSARITVDRKEIYLGSFNTKEEAAKAYNEAAKLYFKQFAKLNEVNT